MNKLMKKIVSIGTTLTVAVMLLGPTVPVGAVTAEELQEQIDELLDSLAGLQAQLAELTGEEAVVIEGVPADFTFDENLGLGSSGDAVKYLQIVLNSDADTQLAASGVGSAGEETTYFGPLTEAAVISFQELYSEDVLAVYGLTEGTGFVGSTTRAKLNSLLAAAEEEEEEEEEVVCSEVTEAVECVSAGCSWDAITETCSGVEEEEEVVCSEVTDAVECVVAGCSWSALTETCAAAGEEEEVPTEGLLTVKANPTPAAGTKLYEGNTDVAILGILAKAKESSITLERLTLQFDARVYHYLSSVAIYDGDELLVEKDLNSDTVYKEGSNYYVQLTELSLKVSKDGSKILTVKVNVKDAIPSYITLASLKTITVPANGIRGVDSIGITQYGPAELFSRAFTMNRTLAGSVSLTISRDADTPLYRNVGTGDIAAVYGVELLRFNAKAKYDSVKITDINSISFAVATTTLASTTETPDTVYVTDTAGTVLGAATVKSGYATITDLEIVVDKDSTKTLILTGDFSEVASTSVSISTTTVTSTKIAGTSGLGKDIEGTGRVESYPLYISTAMPILALTSAKIDKTVAVLGVASSSAKATFVFTITAEGGDITLASTTGSGITVETVKNEDIDETTSATTTYGQPTGSTVDTHGDYTISEDTTVSVTVTSHVSSKSGDFTGDHYDMRIMEIQWRGPEGTWLYTYYTKYLFKTGKVVLP